MTLYLIVDDVRPWGVRRVTRGGDRPGVSDRQWWNQMACSHRSYVLKIVPELVWLTLRARAYAGCLRSLTHLPLAPSYDLLSSFNKGSMPSVILTARRVYLFLGSQKLSPDQTWSGVILSKTRRVPCDPWWIAPAFKVAFRSAFSIALVYSNLAKRNGPLSGWRRHVTVTTRRGLF